MPSPRSGTRSEPSPETVSAPAARELDDLFSATYEELRRLAATLRRSERGQTLSPTALVNEAYVKLAASRRVRAASRLHFKRIAARAMRQVLVEAARRRTALKRGGAGAAFVTLHEDVADRRDVPPADVVALDDALQRLERLDARQAALVEYRFFGGFELAEIAELLGVSASTLARDWRAARAWLALQLRGAEPH